MTGGVTDPDVVTVVVGRFDPLVRHGLTGALREDPRVRVLASDLEDAALERAVAQRAPRVVIVDEAVEHALLERVKARRPATVVLVLAQDPPLLYRTMLLAAGARFLVRSASTEDVTTAVRLAAQGIRKHPPGKELRAGRGVPGRARRVTECEIDGLTKRELEVLGYLSQGMSYAQIALKMHRAEATVKTHSERIRRKLGVKSKHELIGIQIPSSLGIPTA